MCRRWDRFPYQQSEPVQLEKDVPYYFEVFLNQGRGHWEIGLAAKLHDSTLSGGDYDADKESQRIEVISEVIQEEHVRNSITFLNNKTIQTCMYVCAYRINEKKVFKKEEERL